MKFTPPERQALSKYLDTSVIDELAESCSFVGALYHHRRVNPVSFAAERTQFLRISEVAQQLLECFENPSRDWVQLCAIVELGNGATRGTKNTDELLRMLAVLSKGCQSHAARLPARALRHTLEYEVRWIARVVEPIGIKASAAPGSKFTRITRICFGAMGIQSDPGRAIRSYIAHKDDDPLRW